MPQPRSQGTGATPFHSTTSTGFFSLEGTNNTTSQTVSMLSSSSSVSGLEDMAALQESNKVVMERLERNEQPTPSTDYVQSDQTPAKFVPQPPRPQQPGSPLSNTSENAMTETRQDLLQGQS